MADVYSCIVWLKRVSMTLLGTLISFLLYTIFIAGALGVLSSLWCAYGSVRMLRICLVMRLSFVSICTRMHVLILAPFS